MNSLQKAGGIAALVQALAYIVGFIVLLTMMDAGDTSSWSSAQQLAFTLDKKALFQAWIAFIYVGFGVALVVLVVALHERLKARPALMAIASAFGVIWAGFVIAAGMVAIVGLDAAARLHNIDPQQAAETWATISAVHEGLGGGVEIVGGLWLLLLSIAAKRSGALPTTLNVLGIVIGMAGIVTIVPLLADFAAVFGLGQIIWFIWVGATLLTQK